jgi:hypothetical protein
MNAELKKQVAHDLLIMIRAKYNDAAEEYGDGFAVSACLSATIASTAILITEARQMRGLQTDTENVCRMIVDLVHSIDAEHKQ